MRRRRSQRGGKHTSFSQAVKLKADEVVVFARIVYKSRRDRAHAMEKVMSDSRLCAVMDQKSMPFDGKRMFRSGFNPRVGL